MGWMVTIATAIIVIVGVVVLVRQGNPADLAEEEGTDPRADVAGRPAGPGAEPMGVADPGSPSIAPDREA